MSIYVLEMMWIIFCAPILRRTVTIKSWNIPGRVLYIFLIWLVFFSVMALRGTHIGSDTPIYVNMYADIKNAKSFFDAMAVSKISAPVYVGYAYILSMITDSLQWIIVINSFFICTSICWFIYKYSTNVIWSSFFFMALPFYFEAMNGARQFVALAFLLVCYYFLEKKITSKKGWLIYFLAIGVHNTAAIFILVILGLYIKDRVNTLDRIYIIWGIITSTGIMFFSTYIYIFVDLFPYFSRYLYSGANESILVNTGHGRIIILYVIYAIFLGIYYILYRKRPLSKCPNLSMVPMIFVCAVIGIFMGTNTLINRILWYFAIYVIVFIPNVLMELPRKLRIALGLIVIIIFFCAGVTHLVEDKSDIVPYEMFF